MNTTLTLEQKKQKVKDFRPIDDVFFEVLADNREFCQEILRVILEDAKLIVIDVVVQSSNRNMYGRSVRLDALCTLGDGQKVNIEVQRSDKDSHLKRVRFNASSITVKESQTGEAFGEIPEVYIVYISEFDFFEKGRTIYHVDSVIRETGDTVVDGLHRIFVNTVCDDGSDIANLMSCFTKKMVNNPKFPVFSARMRELKEEEGGISHMCEIMEKYERIAAEEGRAEGRAEGRVEGRAEGRLTAICDMIEFGLSKEQILTKYSEDEYNKALQFKTSRGGTAQIVRT